MSILLEILYHYSQDFFFFPKREEPRYCDIEILKEDYSSLHVTDCNTVQTKDIKENHQLYILA